MGPFTPDLPGERGIMEYSAMEPDDRGKWILSGLDAFESVSSKVTPGAGHGGAVGGRTACEFG